ncbi:unnamed protein product [Calicophoron daubneyi]|uniref:Uncharacterized protein n=1 Tax=Calicophoron daubneyi TaxID=300641 RepID=A0AAV2SZ09_CALDB
MGEGFECEDTCGFASENLVPQCECLFDQEDDMGKGFETEEVCEKKAVPPTSSLLQLTDLQEFQGFWKLDSALADCMGIKFKVLTKNQPKQWPAPHQFQMDDKVWATALALAFLEIKHPDAIDEWSLLAKKAKIWMSKQVFGSSKLNDSQNEAIKSVIEQAKLVLSTNQ